MKNQIIINPTIPQLPIFQPHPILSERQLTLLLSDTITANKAIKYHSKENVSKGKVSGVVLDIELSHKSITVKTKMYVPTDNLKYITFDKNY